MAQTESSTQAPVKLFGRIEQLINEKGAVLPGRMQKMTPLLDTTTSSIQSQTAFSGEEVKSFPLAWEGSWKGFVTVTKRECLELGWLSQPAASYRSSQFFKPGSQLSLICRFNKDGNALSLSPPVASARFTHTADLVKSIIQETGAGSARFSRNPLMGMDPGGMPNDGTTPISRIETFSFGKRYGPSMGGNFINSDIQSNQLRELAPGTVEQDIVTSSTTQSMYGVPEAVSSFGESVVRLTRKDDKLLVSVAYVNYEHDGFCVGKCVLEGTLERVGD
ncbi:MAG: hypothetical protein K2X81_13910 [Candidatus Obscuribacterales bacterium]|nr:hypothetical protein [Candidatus Obscuribacterales bacterium]